MTKFLDLKRILKLNQFSIYRSIYQTILIFTNSSMFSVPALKMLNVLVWIKNYLSYFILVIFKS